MLRIVLALGLISAAGACMTEADKQLWAEFQTEIKSDKDSETKIAPNSEGQQKAEEEAFSEKLNAKPPTEAKMH